MTFAREWHIWWTDHWATISQKTGQEKAKHRDAVQGGPQSQAPREARAGACVSSAPMQRNLTAPALRILVLKKNLTLVSYRRSQYLFSLHWKQTWTVRKAQECPVSLDLFPGFFPAILNTQAFMFLQFWEKRWGRRWGLLWHLWTGGVYVARMSCRQTYLGHPHACRSSCGFSAGAWHFLVEQEIQHAICKVPPFLLFLPVWVLFNFSLLSCFS